MHNTTRLLFAMLSLWPCCSLSTLVALQVSALLGSAHGAALMPRHADAPDTKQKQALTRMREPKRRARAVNAEREKRSSLSQPKKSKKRASTVVRRVSMKVDQEGRSTLMTKEDGRSPFVNEDVLPIVTARPDSPSVIRRVSMKVEKDGGATAEAPPRRKLDSSSLSSTFVPLNTSITKSTEQIFPYPPYNFVLQYPESGPVSPTRSSMSSFLRSIFFGTAFAMFVFVAFKIISSYRQGSAGLGGSSTTPRQRANQVRRSMSKSMLTGKFSHRISKGRESSQSLEDISRSRSKESCDDLSRAKEEPEALLNTVKNPARKFTAAPTWRVNKKNAEPRVEMLFNALAKQTNEEYFRYNASDNLQDHLKSHGVRVNVDSLKQEIKNGYCRLLRMPSAAAEERASPTSMNFRRLSDDDGQLLVRCVRIVRVVVKGRTLEGMRTLIENDLSNEDGDDLFPASKVRIDACEAQTAWVSVLHEKLGLPNNWLQQFLTLHSCADTTVRVSNECPRLPTWCIVDEAFVHVNDNADISELRLLGLPAGGIFRGTGINRQHIWLWADLHEVTEQDRSRSCNADRKSANEGSTASKAIKQGSKFVTDPGRSHEASSPNDDDSDDLGKEDAAAQYSIGTASESVHSQQSPLSRSRSQSPTRRGRIDSLTCSPENQRGRVSSEGPKNLPPRGLRAAAAARTAAASTDQRGRSPPRFASTATSSQGPRAAAQAGQIRTPSPSTASTPSTVS
jgi:hypothetical protein